MVIPIWGIVRIHVRITDRNPRIPVADQLAATRQVFAKIGIRIDVVSITQVTDPRVMYVGNCDVGYSRAQEYYYCRRVAERATDLVAYVVRQTDFLMGGCATHPPDCPGLVVSRYATPWTFAHEVGHVLGLDHVDPPDGLSLMTPSTADIRVSLPQIPEFQVETLNNSQFVSDGSDLGGD